ncbi:UDP-N-acetylglucosamine 2-epimerase (non-hydrolyzing), partial [Frankia sp. Cpl3]|nr:UDP-N-acetylglucosamine 2-epimerase (non-hydrolyzing) [Frankia sp. Cpl3]
DYTHPVLEKVAGKKMVLMTAHRRENLGEPMRRIFRAVRRLVDEHPDIAVVYPVHLNPAVQELAQELLGSHERIQLIAPLDAFDFHNFARRAHLILTDSGGVQEEAPSLGVPVLVLRDTTERPEGIEAGTLKLAGTDEEQVYEMADHLLGDASAYEAMAKAANPYGDGNASRRIVEAILHHFGLRQERPAPFLPGKTKEITEAL